MIALLGMPILPGEVAGPVLAANVPLSFWGGYDPATGRIIDPRHPLAGHDAGGRILVIPSGRGSCSGSGVLLEAIRNGTAPVAIITSRVDPIIALGAILGDELYASYPVLVLVDESTRAHIKSRDWLSIAEDGQLMLNRHQDDVHRDASASAPFPQLSD